MPYLHLKLIVSFTSLVNFLYHFKISLSIWKWKCWLSAVGIARESLLSMLIVAGGRIKSRSARIDASESGVVAGGCGRVAATPHATMHCVHRWKCRKVGTFLDSEQLYAHWCSFCNYPFWCRKKWTTSSHLKRLIVWLTLTNTIFWLIVIKNNFCMSIYTHNAKIDMQHLTIRV